MDAAAESVRKFRTELAAAVGRGQRARTDAQRRTADFRRNTEELAERAGRTGDGEQRAEALAHRNRMGLEVPELTGPIPAAGSTEDTGVADEKAAKAGKSQEQTPSDGSDLDFSQAQIMR
ncbi:hypothetical protein SAMN05421805_108138 [Saccharopolyspora antimicrobica]|uniref:Uncharacterized protein n=1 Tax=Saccharopolyspora antimicrobica TaxID=455193 RepID=A0A1I5DHA0_9PSEU|nr:hypothetical protein [Saccharopolyspora antimicrobica]RKT85116.1 hypothetical protein ATL45_3452 [Saccharopolyspora antimicrobica]SFN98609.1 hypothetical protein SAMN05421805_108138 [Saccharopolyspora antimicrobica]